jgi:hypothetical protein
MGLLGGSYHSDDTMPHCPLLSHGNESLVVLRLVASRAAHIPLRVGSSWVVVWREWMLPAFNGTAEQGAAADAADSRRAAELSR